MGNCGLYLGRRQVGNLRWEQKDGRLMAECSCPFEEGLIYRVVLQTDRGLHRLGVMLPEGQRFTLCRELPAGTLPQSAYIDRTLPEERHLPGLPLAFSSFERDERETDALGCAPNSPLLCGDWMETRYLLIPLPSDGQCCAPQLLCVAALLEHEGSAYGLVRKQGGRYLPPTDRLRTGDVLW